MSRLQKIIWAIGLVLLVLAIFFLSLGYPYSNKSLKWRDIRVENLKLDSSPNIYKIDSGRILTQEGGDAALSPSFNLITSMKNDRLIRIALFYQINKEEPLFFGPGLEVSELRQATEKLRASQVQLKAVLKLDQDVYPVEFLDAVVAADEAYQNFQLNPSQSSAAEMLKKERKAVTLYRRYAKQLRSRLVRTKLPGELFAEGGALTSKEVITGDLKSTIENARKLEAEIAARERCLNVSTIFCRRPVLKPFRSASELAVDSSQIFQPRDTQSGLKLESKIYQVGSPCWKEKTNAPEIHLLYALQDKRVSIPQLAGSRYFEPLSPEGFGDFLYEAYKKLGVEWKVTYMDNAYTCNNLEYQANLTTLNAYYTKYSQDPIFTDEIIKNLPPDLTEKAKMVSELEKTFNDEKYPNQQTMDKIAAGYASIYNELVSKENQSDFKPTDKQLELQQQLLFRFGFINNRLADYQKNLNYLSLRNVGHAKMSEINIKGKVEQDYNYFMRSAYSITLLGFSPSVWRSDTRLRYLVPNTTINRTFLNNTDFIKKFGADYAKKVDSINREAVLLEMEKDRKK